MSELNVLYNQLMPWDSLDELKKVIRNNKNSLEEVEMKNMRVDLDLINTLMMECVKINNLKAEVNIMSRDMSVVIPCLSWAAVMGGQAQMLHPKLAKARSPKMEISFRIFTSS